MEDKILVKKFRQTIRVLADQHGPQGWWPRLIRDGREIRVTHYAANKRFWLSKTKNAQIFEVALGAILTQNTAWANVEKALVCLAQKKALTPRSILDIPISILASCIRSSGYFNQKAKKLKIFSRFVINDLKQNWSDCTRDRLLFLWGLGPETADTILCYALNQPVFVIDAYTRRLLVHLSQDEKWLKCSYDEIQKFCKSTLSISPQETHALIVKWGKEDHEVASK